MLHAEPKNYYDVYPSWADYQVKWHDLPRLLSDPLNSGLLHLDDLQSVEDGTFPNVPDPFEMIDGPAGGGILIRTQPRLPGLSWCVLNSFADVSVPMGVNFEIRDHQANVVYLEPSRSLYLLERRPKVYDNCEISFDHTESAGDHAYWFAAYETGETKLREVDENPAIGRRVWTHRPAAPAASGSSPPKRLIGDGKRIARTTGTSSKGAAMESVSSTPSSFTSDFTFAKSPAAVSRDCTWPRSLKRRPAFARFWPGGEHCSRRSAKRQRTTFAATIRELSRHRLRSSIWCRRGVPNVTGKLTASSLRDGSGLIPFKNWSSTTARRIVIKTLNLFAVLYLRTAAADTARSLKEHERPLCEIVRRFPLGDVVFEPVKEVGYAKSNLTHRYLILAGEGRLILVGENGRRLDPGYGIMEYMGRYYLHVADIVAEDAADALTTGREPLFVCLRMEDLL